LLPIPQGFGKLTGRVRGPYQLQKPKDIMWPLQPLANPRDVWGLAHSYCA